MERMLKAETHRREEGDLIIANKVALIENLLIDNKNVGRQQRSHRGCIFYTV